MYLSNIFISARFIDRSFHSFCQWDKSCYLSSLIFPSPRICIDIISALEFIPVVSFSKGNYWYELSPVNISYFWTLSHIFLCSKHCHPYRAENNFHPHLSPIPLSWICPNKLTDYSNPLSNIRIKTFLQNRLDSSKQNEIIFLSLNKLY